MLERYIINIKTSAIESIFDNYGNEYTMVYEQEKCFRVQQSPAAIVKNSFKFIGYDYKAAIRGAKSILNIKYKVPLALSALSNVVLIPCKPLDNCVNKGSIWLVNSHIDRIEPLTKEGNSSIVITKYGQSIIVATKPELLGKKRLQATFLHIILLERTRLDIL